MTHICFTEYSPSLPPATPAPCVDVVQLANGWQKTSGINRDDYMVNPVSGGTVTLDHILAAEFIQKAFRRFLEFR